MVNRFFVPKFITIEDKLAGILTFRQLFALLGAFLLSFFMFRINQFLGLLTALISFSLSLILTFININGKPFLYILPRFFDFLFGNKKFTWRRIEKVTYKEIDIPKELEVSAVVPKISKRKIVDNNAEVILEYPDTNIKEKLTISLEEPIATQAEKIHNLAHRHLINPKNPYRLFPYVKFYRSLK